MADLLCCVLGVSLYILIYSRSANAQSFVDSSLAFSNKDIACRDGFNLNYTWYFETYDGSQLELSFKNLTIRRFTDFIVVGERSNGVKRQILRWTGTDYFNQLKVLTHGNNLWLTLQSFLPDVTQTFTGLIRVVNMSSSENEVNCFSGFDCGNGVCLTSTDTCNGIVNCDNHADEICQENINVNSSVNFTSIKSYPPYYQYTWYFATQTGSNLQLTFENISIEETFDHVTVGEGNDTSRGQLLSLSGSPDVKLIKVVSSGSLLWVRFTSDESGHSGVIAGKVQRVNGQDEWNCSSEIEGCSGVCLPLEMHCKGYVVCENCPEHCSEDEGKCSHEDRCYSTAERCNNEADCFLSDDENNCNRTVSLNNKYTPFKYHKFTGIIRYTSGNGSKLSLSFVVFERENLQYHILVGESNDSISPLLDVTSNTSTNRIFNVMSSGNTLWVNFETESGFIGLVRLINQTTAVSTKPPSVPVCPANIFVTMETSEVPTIFTPPTCTDEHEGVLFAACTPGPDHSFDEEETGVVCSCSNSAGISSNCTFMVFVTRAYITTPYIYSTNFTISTASFIDSTEPTTQKQNLDVITIIGLILCIIGLVCCICIICLVRTFRTNQPSQIQANLCAALCALYLTLVIAIRKTDNGLTCNISALLINAFFLSLMSWVSVDAHHLFLCYVRRVKTYPKYFLLKAGCFAWGFPVVGTVLVFIFNKSDNLDKDTTFCFLHHRYGLNVWILIPSSMHFVYNCVILATSAFKIYFANFSSNEEDDKRKAVDCTRNAFYTRFLMAMSLLFCVLAMNFSSQRIIFELIFVTCMTLQVIVVFRILLIQSSSHRKVFTIFKSVLPSPQTVYKMKKLKRRRPSPPSFQLLEMNDEFEKATDDITHDIII